MSQLGYKFFALGRHVMRRLDAAHSQLQPVDHRIIFLTLSEFFSPTAHNADQCATWTNAEIAQMIDYSISRVSTSLNRLHRLGILHINHKASPRQIRLGDVFLTPAAKELDSATDELKQDLEQGQLRLCFDTVEDASTIIEQGREEIKSAALKVNFSTHKGPIAKTQSPLCKIENHSPLRKTEVTETACGAKPQTHPVPSWERARQQPQQPPARPQAVAEPTATAKAVSAPPKPATPAPQPARSVAQAHSPAHAEPHGWDIWRAAWQECRANEALKPPSTVAAWLPKLAAFTQKYTPEVARDAMARFLRNKRVQRHSMAVFFEPSWHDEALSEALHAKNQQQAKAKAQMSQEAQKAAAIQQEQAEKAALAAQISRARDEIADRPVLVWSDATKTTIEKEIGRLPMLLNLRIIPMFGETILVTDSKYSRERLQREYAKDITRYLRMDNLNSAFTFSHFNFTQLGIVTR